MLMPSSVGSSQHVDKDTDKNSRICGFEIAL